MNYIYAGIVACLLMLVSALAGYKYEDNAWALQDAKDQAAIQAHLNQAEKENDALAAVLSTQSANVNTTTIYVTKRIPYAVDHYITVPGAPVEDRPAYQLTWAAVGLFDTAIGVPVSGPAACAVADPPCAQALILSPYTIDSALAVYSENAAICRTAIDGYEGWQKWYANVKSAYK